MAGCPQALCVHTVCAANAQIRLNCNDTIQNQKEAVDMPTTYAHERFGREVWKKLPKELK